MSTNVRLFLVLFFAVAFWSCQTEKPYQFSSYHGPEQQDSLMVDIIRHVYKVPKGVAKEDKWLASYKPLYEKQVPNFRMLYYHQVDSSAMYYFFLIRPARNVHGHKRGVIGRYALGEDDKMEAFEELINTPMLAEPEIEEKAKYLWQDLIRYGHLDRYINDRTYVEFPDGRAAYDKEKKEWRYDVALED